MQLIPIAMPTDYFQIQTNVGNDVWVFTFRWNETYSLFHVDVLLNNVPQILSLACLGGVFVLNNFDMGYNFLFLGGPINNTSALGTDLTLNLIELAEAQTLGLINASGP